MKKNAYLILGDKIVSLGINGLKSEDYLPPAPYDGLSIKNTIAVLEGFNLNIKTITYYDLLAENFPTNSIFIVSQWILNRFRDAKDILISLRKKINLISQNGSHFILMHHFWPYFIFRDILDIEYYKGNKRGWFLNKFHLKVLRQHETIHNVRSFIENNENSLESDEFTFLFKEKSNFNTLVTKIPKKREPKNFISYGYQKNENSFIFLLDIHNIGKVESHSQYFDLLFSNTIKYLIER